MGRDAGDTGHVGSVAPVRRIAPPLYAMLLLTMLKRPGGQRKQARSAVRAGRGELG